MRYFLHASSAIRCAVRHAIPLLISEAPLKPAVVSLPLWQIASAVFCAETHADNGNAGAAYVLLLVCDKLDKSARPSLNARNDI
jgi:hypothetical protein